MKSITLILVTLGMFAAGDVFAEGSLPERAGNGIKKGGQAAGRGLEKGAEATGRGLKKGGEATVKGLKKAESWVGKNMQKGGQKLEKASE